ncbi:MAG: DUF2779 domain-containing protein [Deinococcales bacterium]
MDAHRPRTLTLDSGRIEAWGQCERRAWLQAHAPAEAGEPDGLARYLAIQRADLRRVLRATVGLGNREAPKPSDVASGRPGTDALGVGQALLDVSFEAPMTALAPSLARGPDLRVRTTVDMLERAADGLVLTTLATGARVREHHVRRLALTSLVAAARGWPAGTMRVLHVDRRGHHDDASELLASVDVTERCLNEQRHLPLRLEAVAASVVASREPDTAVGSHCFRPRRCPFVDRCWGRLQGRSIDRVWGLRSTTRRAWRSAGWLELEHVPDAPPGLTAQERLAVRDTLEGRVRVDRTALGAALARLRFPIAYLDMEFATPAVPLVEGSAPFEPLPFQFSVHLEGADGGVEALACLRTDPDEDPRRPLAEALAPILQRASSIVVYDAGSEHRLLEALADAAPAVAPSLRSAGDRLWDLLPTIQNALRHPGFAARWDLKQVATTLAPGSYRDVHLADGLAAQAVWRGLLRTHRPDREAALHRYCEADSRAMLEIVRVLRRWSQPGGGPAEGRVSPPRRPPP